MDLFLNLVHITGRFVISRCIHVLAIQPRPKSMFPQNARSKTQEIDSVTVNEALSGLTYSKSFNAADEPSSRGNGSPMLRPKVNYGYLYIFYIWS